MGFSLHIQRSDGRDGDLPETDIASVISLFESIPWKEDVAQWKALPQEERELRRPILQVFDDSGHSLHVMAYSDHLIGVAYNFPAPSSPFGVIYEEEEAYIGTDQYPRGEIHTLLECFFASDTEAMLAHLEAFPAINNEQLP